MNKFTILKKEHDEIYQWFYISDYLHDLLLMISDYPDICENKNLISQLQLDYIQAEVKKQYLLNNIKNKYLSHIKQNVLIKLGPSNTSDVYYSIGG